MSGRSIGSIPSTPHHASYLLGIPTAHNHGFRYGKGGSGPYNRVPVFLSKIVDVHGRQYATDIEKVLYAGRKIVFLSAPLYTGIAFVLNQNISKT